VWTRHGRVVGFGQSHYDHEPDQFRVVDGWGHWFDGRDDDHDSIFDECSVIIGPSRGADDDDPALTGWFGRCPTWQSRDLGAVDAAGSARGSSIGCGQSTPCQLF
jgi:hypothetical protein